MAWSLADVLLAINGKIVRGPTSAVNFKAISTDTRSLCKGDLFIALEGEHFNGAAFIGTAIDKGAAGVMVNAGSAPANVQTNEATVPVIAVSDTLKALGDLAAFRRRILPKIRVLAITGSCGKTTVKEMTAAIVARKFNTLKTVGNFNNLVGLPLSLLPATTDHDVAILEMGMNRPGEIARLTEIAAPDVCCITNIRDAHLAGLSTIEGVARAKGELFASSKPSSKLVVNLDDARVRQQARPFGKRRQITFAATAGGRRHRPVVRATHVKSLGGSGTVFTLGIGGRRARVRLRIAGRHNVENAVTAAALAHTLGIPLTDIVSGLNSFLPYDKRMQIGHINGLRIINDSYNANPSSMRAALKTLQDAGKNRLTVAILGDMLELGDGSAKAHRELGTLAAQLRIDFLAAFGNFADAVTAGAIAGGMPGRRAKSFTSKEKIAAWICDLLDTGEISTGDWLLVKGSRSMQMESLLTDLQKNLKTVKN